jgi:nitrite reductase (NADH) small subunit
MMQTEHSPSNEIATPRWVRIARRDEIPAREGRTALVDGREIAIFNLGDRFLALDNRCPHRGGPLADGILAGHTVVCPLHAWKVNLETGTVERPASANPCIRQYATRVEGDLVAIAYPN